MVHGMGVRVVLHPVKQPVVLLGRELPMLQLMMAMVMLVSWILDVCTERSRTSSRGLLHLDMS